MNVVRNLSPNKIRLFVLSFTLLIMLATMIVGYQAYVSSRDAVLNTVYQSNLDLARALRDFSAADKRGRSETAVLSDLQTVWNNMDRSKEGDFLCVIDKKGILTLHTGAKERVGVDVGKSPIHPTNLKTLQELIAEKNDYVGPYLSGSGQNQIAAFAYAEGMDSVISIHVPYDRIEKQIFDTTLPWIISLMIIGGLLLPLSNLLLHRLYALSNIKVKESEAHLRTLVQSLPDLVWLKDAEGVYLSCNPKFERFFGSKEAEIVGKTDYDFVDKELADFFRKHDKRAIAAGKLTINEQEITYADDGHKEILETVKTPMYASDGTLIGVLGVGRDITERKKMEEQIYSSEQHLRLYREQAPLATIEWNTDFQILDWNKEAEKMFGYTVEEVRGKNFVDIMLPESPVIDIKKHWQDLISQTAGEISINENLTKDGRTIICEWHNTSLKNETGKIIGAASIVQDITGRTELQEQLRRTLKMDALGKLTGGIAHDYNNMMSIVLGYSELLEEEIKGKEKASEYLKQIQQAGERAKELTQKLMTFSRSKTSEKESVNINEQLEHQRQLLEKTLTARIKLSFELDDNIWLTQIDSGDFNDAIINITINASHAINANGTLKISTRNIQLNNITSKSLDLPPGEYIALSLSDSGKGMDPQTTSKIFDPFFSTKGDEGTGLGLSQVYGFVTRSGGAIKVNSELNLGTELVLYFPRYYDSNSEQDILEITNNNVSQPSHETILVVDDEQALCNMAKEILANQGYHVLRAFSGAEALEILKTERVDIVFSDVIMPEMTGYELAEKISDKYPDILIQLTSGYAGDEKLKSLNNSSTFDVLDKPYTSTELLNEITTLLKK